MALHVFGLGSGRGSGVARDPVPSSIEERNRRFEQLIMPEIAFLARTARSMSGSEADAEDLAQDTLVKALAAMGTFDGRYPRAWLFRIARNTAITRDRRHKAALVPDAELLQVDRAAAPGHASEPEGVVVDRVVDESLQTAIDRLPPSFRLVVQLVDVEGMRYQEAADVLEVPVGTVMSRLHRARNQLRRALEGTNLTGRAP